jgi:hypothetical protein
MAMVPPSAPRTNRTLSEMVPERCLTLALERTACAPPGTASSSIRSSAAKWALDLFRAASSQCVGSALQLFPPFRPNGVTIRSQGTKAPVKTLEARGRRSPLTTRRMSRIAKDSLLQGPLFSKTRARADSQKRRPAVPFQNCQPCSQAGGVRANASALLTPTRLLMHNRIDIDPKHSQAIVQEIGERLRAFLKEEPELPGSLKSRFRKS